MTSTKVLLIGYLLMILLGALLLMLPIASQRGVSTPFFDALFTSVASTCVTGVMLFDVYLYWSLFGQIVILFLVQIGGLGFLTMTILVFSLTKRRIGLKHRVMMQESIAAHQPGGIVRLTRLVFSTTLIMEGAGCALLSIRFCPMLGVGKGLYFSLFHSVSAFCNAGIDLMGAVELDSSLLHVSDDVLINVVIMLLSIVGGLGFFVWGDLWQNKFRVHKYALQTKVVLSMTLILIIVPSIFFFALEFNQIAMEGKGVGGTILACLFQSVSMRSMGFYTVDIGAMQQASLLIMMLLMLIGGAPGSTAGGMKTTTVAVIAFSVGATLRKREDVQCFQRRISGHVVRLATTIVFLYLFVFLTATILLSALEGLDIFTSMFESAAALGTAGLTTGAVQTFGLPARLVLCGLMYLGRLGGLTVLYAMLDRVPPVPSRLPLGKIVVG